MTSLFGPLGFTAVALTAATALGFFASRFWLSGRAFSVERLAESFAIGCGLVVISAALAYAAGVRSVAIVLAVVGAIAIAAALRWPVRVEANSSNAEPPPATPTSAGVIWMNGIWLVLIALGLALYLLRALTEPMWSNDFLAIWGLKGRAIYFARSIPASLRLPEYGFSHPEYPLGLPLLYAGLASITGVWDDQALALLFPCFQAATLLALAAWLVRRGSDRTASLAAAALLSLLTPLYSAFATGMADIPFAFAGLLFATALSDSLDRTDMGAIRRLGLASILCAGVKNEGLFLAAAGAVIAVVSASRGRRRVWAAAVLPAALLVAVQRLVVGRAPLRDFDFGFLGPRVNELPARLAEDLRAAVATATPSWLFLLALAALFAAGRRSPRGDRILALAAALFAAYLILPVFAVLGPAWLISTSFARTTAALAPMFAAGLTARLSGEASAAGGDPRAWEARAEGPTLSTPAS